MFRPIEKSSENCNGCPLLTETNRVHTYVPGEPNPSDPTSVRILAMAEAPAKDEKAAGRPLAPQGTSGKRFRAEMQRSGLVAIPHYIANVVMCTNLEVAPKARGGFKTFNPPEEAYPPCRPKWQRLVKELAPEIVFLLGESAVKAVGLNLIGEDFAAMRKRINFGEPVCLSDPRVIVTRHPSGLTYQKRGGKAWKEFASDFDLVFSLLNSDPG